MRLRHLPLGDRDGLGDGVLRHRDAAAGARAEVVVVGLAAFAAGPARVDVSTTMSPPFPSASTPPVAILGPAVAASSTPFADESSIRSIRVTRSWLASFRHHSMFSKREVRGVRHASYPSSCHSSSSPPSKSTGRIRQPSPARQRHRRAAGHPGQTSAPCRGEPHTHPGRGSLPRTAGPLGLDLLRQVPRGSVEELELVALGRCEPLFGSPSIASVLKGAIAQPTAK